MQPFFLDGLDGPLFANFFAAEVGAAAYVFAPPFAEELNRSRHMMARLARAAAEAGHSVLLLDPFGTGDSGGRFEDGSWPRWQDDLAAGATWLKRQGYARVGLMALRTGALLAASFKDIHHLILWSPVISGEQFLTQFLRLKVAEAMARDAASKETTKDLKARLDAGETLEIGGYALTPAMAAELGAAKLTDAAPRCPVDWIEVGSAPSPAAERAAAAWAEASVAVTLSAVEGPMFWSLLEPEVADALIDVTVAAMSREAAR